MYLYWKFIGILILNKELILNLDYNFNSSNEGFGGNYYIFDKRSRWY